MLQLAQQIGAGVVEPWLARDLQRAARALALADRRAELCSAAQIEKNKLRALNETLVGSRGSMAQNAARKREALERQDAAVAKEQAFRTADVRAQPAARLCSPTRCPALLLPNPLPAAARRCPPCLRRGRRRWDHRRCCCRACQGPQPVCPSWAAARVSVVGSASGSRIQLWKDADLTLPGRAASGACCCAWQVAVPSIDLLGNGTVYCADEARRLLAAIACGQPRSAAAGSASRLQQPQQQPQPQQQQPQQQQQQQQQQLQQQQQQQHQQEGYI